MCNYNSYWIGIQSKKTYLENGLNILKNILKSVLDNQGFPNQEI